jgi:hypothetical protein
VALLNGQTKFDLARLGVKIYLIFGLQKSLSQYSSHKSFYLHKNICRENKVKSQNNFKN